MHAVGTNKNEGSLFLPLLPLIISGAWLSQTQECSPFYGDSPRTSTYFKISRFRFSGSLLLFMKRHFFNESTAMRDKYFIMTFSSNEVLGFDYNLMYMYDIII